MSELLVYSDEYILKQFWRKMAENPVTVMKRFHISEKYGFMLEDPLVSFYLYL